MTPYYDDGACVIYHADCREILRRQDDGSVDLVIADPPYGVGMIYGDSYDDTLPNIHASISDELFRVSRLVFVTPGIRNVSSWPSPTWMLCWHKPGSPRRSDLGGFNIWEPILMYGKRRIYNDALSLPAWNNTASGTGDHPCPKPLRLFRWLVEQGSDAGDTILDPFMGSGTTLRAAKDLGRKAIGIEIEERYCEIAAKRLQQEVLPLEVA